MEKISPRRPIEDLQLSDECTVKGHIVQHLPQFQIDGIRYLYQKFISKEPIALLNDETGLGKTFQVVAFLDGILCAQSDNRKCIIVCQDESRVNHWMYHFQLLSSIRTCVLRTNLDADEHSEQILIIHVLNLVKLLTGSNRGLHANLVIIDDCANELTIRQWSSIGKIKCDFRIMVVTEDMTVHPKQLFTILKTCNSTYVKDLKVKDFEDQMCTDSLSLNQFLKKRHQIMLAADKYRLRRYKQEVSKELPLIPLSEFRKNFALWQHALESTISKDNAMDPDNEECSILITDIVVEPDDKVTKFNLNRTSLTTIEVNKTEGHCASIDVLSLEPDLVLKSTAENTLSKLNLTSPEDGLTSLSKSSLTQKTVKAIEVAKSKRPSPANEVVNLGKLDSIEKSSMNAQHILKEPFADNEVENLEGPGAATKKTITSVGFTSVIAEPQKPLHAEINLTEKELNEMFEGSESLFYQDAESQSSVVIEPHIDLTIATTSAQAARLEISASPMLFETDSDEDVEFIHNKSNEDEPSISNTNCLGSHLYGYSNIRDKSHSPKKSIIINENPNPPAKKETLIGDVTYEGQQLSDSVTLVETDHDTAFECQDDLSLLQYSSSSDVLCVNERTMVPVVEISSAEALSSDRASPDLFADDDETNIESLSSEDLLALNLVEPNHFLNRSSTPVLPIDSPNVNNVTDHFQITANSSFHNELHVNDLNEMSALNVMEDQQAEDVFEITKNSQFANHLRVNSDDEMSPLRVTESSEDANIFSQSKIVNVAPLKPFGDNDGVVNMPSLKMTESDVENDEINLLNEAIVASAEKESDVDVIEASQERTPTRKKFSKTRTTSRTPNSSERKKYNKRNSRVCVTPRTAKRRKLSFWLTETEEDAVKSMLSCSQVSHRSERHPFLRQRMLVSSDEDF